MNIIESTKLLLKSIKIYGYEYTACRINNENFYSQYSKVTCSGKITTNTNEPISSINDIVMNY